MYFFSTFVCPTELVALDERIQDFDKLNAQVIGVSIDSQYTHLAWMGTSRSVSIRKYSILIGYAWTNRLNL